MFELIRVLGLSTNLVTLEAVRITRERSVCDSQNKRSSFEGLHLCGWHKKMEHGWCVEVMRCHGASELLEEAGPEFPAMDLQSLESQ